MKTAQDIRELAPDTLLAFTTPSDDPVYSCITARALLQEIREPEDPDWFEFEGLYEAKNWKVYVAKKRSPYLKDWMVSRFLFECELDGCEDDNEDDEGETVHPRKYCVRPLKHPASDENMVRRITEYICDVAKESGIWYGPDEDRPVDVSGVLTSLTIMNRNKVK